MPAAAVAATAAIEPTMSAIFIHRGRYMWPSQGVAQKIRNPVAEIIDTNGFGPAPRRTRKNIGATPHQRARQLNCTRSGLPESRRDTKPSRSDKQRNRLSGQPMFW